jgi:hypothetical protein
MTIIVRTSEETNHTWKDKSIRKFTTKVEKVPTGRATFSVKMGVMITVTVQADTQQLPKAAVFPGNHPRDRQFRVMSRTIERIM